MKCKVIAKIAFEIEVESKVKINEYLEELLPKDFGFSVEQITHSSKQVFGTFSIEEVLPFITDARERKKYIGADGKEYWVKMDSHRYQVFAQNLACAACGIEGVKFVLELPSDAQSPHFNLYAEEHGQLILMTKDHICPKNNGGSDHINNYQTMCSICNGLKGSYLMTNEDIAKLRKVYDNGRRGMSPEAMSIEMSR